MFTGIVEEIGHVVGMPAAGRAGELEIAASVVLSDVSIGDSIAVNGVCLTVTRFTSARFAVDVMPETISRSGLGALRVGSPVNLERAVRLGGRMGGHIVSGHIDGTGTIVSRRADENATRLRIRCPAQINGLIVEKGSIAIDGVSLTVSQLFDDGFEVSIIPHTGQATILLDKRPGETVNLENDVIGKYVRRLLQTGQIGQAEEAGLEVVRVGEADRAGHAGQTGAKFASLAPPESLGDRVRRQGQAGGSTSGSTSAGITLEYRRAHGF